MQTVLEDVNITIKSSPPTLTTINSKICSIIFLTTCWLITSSCGDDIAVEEPDVIDHEFCSQFEDRKSCQANGCTQWVDSALIWRVTPDGSCSDMRTVSMCWTNVSGRPQQSSARSGFYRVLEDGSYENVALPYLPGEDIDGWGYCATSDDTPKCSCWNDPAIVGG